MDIDGSYSVNASRSKSDKTAAQGRKRRGKKRRSKRRARVVIARLKASLKQMAEQWEQAENELRRVKRVTSTMDRDVDWEVDYGGDAARP
jgi:hypothetical protein